MSAPAARDLLLGLALAAALAACRAEEPAAARRSAPADPAPVSRAAQAAAETAAVDRVMDDFHDAAAHADGARYFGHFTDDAVFLGTDATERWTLPEFRGFAEPYFARGQGWTYTPRSRHVALSPDGRTAWFDEALNNDSYGECRGTGVLEKVGNDWKIAHYSLTIPIPNEIAKEVVAKIRERGKAAATAPP